MIQPRFDIIILNWNAYERTIDCLTSLQEQTYPHARIIVVDNGSQDGSISYIQARFPNIELIALPRNVGFAGGVNRALRKVSTPEDGYIVLLNNDTLVGKDFLEQVAAQMQSRPDIGIASPKVLYNQQDRMLWGIGGRMLSFWLIVFGMAEKDTAQYDTAELDFVFGCAMIIRREILAHIGLLDEHFFFYYEDIDLCLRAKQAGYSIALFPTILVWHDGSWSTRATPALREFYHIRSRMIFFHKHLCGVYRWLFFLREIPYIASMVRRYTMRRDLTTVGAYLKGLLQGIAHGRILQQSDKNTWHRCKY